MKGLTGRVACGILGQYSYPILLSDNGTNQYVEGFLSGIC